MKLKDTTNCVCAGIPLTLALWRMLKKKTEKVLSAFKNKEYKLELLFEREMFKQVQNCPRTMWRLSEKLIFEVKAN